MLKYKLHTTKSWYPQILLNYSTIKWYKDDMMLNEELNNLSYLESIKQIVSELEEVKKWERDKVVFWFETTMIWSYEKWKWYYWEKYPNSQVTITYNYADDYIVTDLEIEDILKMMTEWRDYIDAWEKETGKVYNGI